MIKQFKRYNELINIMHENAVQISEVEEYFNFFKSFIPKLDTLKETLEEINEIRTEIEGNIDPVVALGNYERLNILKSSMDIFNLMLENSGAGQKLISGLSRFRGLKSNDRLVVFLVSGFSAGKTTFAGRLLGVSSAGETGGSPTTACLVVHKNDVAASLEIILNKEIVLKSEISKKNTDMLVKFLYEHRIKHTRKSSDTFILEDENIINIEGETERKILSILQEANSFPEAFEKITWNHKRGDNNSFLNFADLYDMPGFGGYDSHDVVIDNVFKKYKPDVILYLIHTTKGLVNDTEVEALSKFLPVVLKYTPQPLFCWVYQMASHDMKISNAYDKNVFFDKSFLEKDEKKEVLVEFIKSAIKDDYKNKIKSIINEMTDSDKAKRLNEELLTNPRAEKNKTRFEIKCSDFLSENYIFETNGYPKNPELAKNGIFIFLEKFCGEILSEDAKIYFNNSKEEGKKEVLKKFIKDFMDDDYAENYIKEMKIKIENEKDETQKIILDNELNRSVAVKYKGYFNKECFNYLSKSFILDARGGEIDAEMAQNAVSIILEKHYFTRGMEFCREVEEILKMETQKAENRKIAIPESITPVLKDIENSDMLVTSAQSIIYGAVHINKDENLSDISSDKYSAMYLKVNLDLLMKNIEILINEIIDLIKHKVLNLISSKKINAESLKNAFDEKSKVHELWQILINYAYLVYNIKYDPVPRDIINISHSMLGMIKKNIMRFEEINKKFPLLANMDDKTDSKAEN